MEDIQITRDRPWKWNY